MDANLRTSTLCRNSFSGELSGLEYFFSPFYKYMHTVRWCGFSFFFSYSFSNPRFCRFCQRLRAATVAVRYSNRRWGKNGKCVKIFAKIYTKETVVTSVWISDAGCTSSIASGCIVSFDCRKSIVFRWKYLNNMFYFSIWENIALVK